MCLGNAHYSGYLLFVLRRLLGSTGSASLHPTKSGVGPTTTRFVNLFGGRVVLVSAQKDEFDKDKGLDKGLKDEYELQPEFRGIAHTAC